MKITTKRGDKGYTSLLDGRRVPKNSRIIELFSSVDKLISFLGVCEHNKIKEAEEIQKLLYSVFSELAYGKDISDTYHKLLESKIEELQNQLPELKNFLIPLGRASYVHYARALARECEIKAVSLRFSNTIIFFNRLSDYLFLIAYKISIEENDEETFG